MAEESVDDGRTSNDCSFALTKSNNTLFSFYKEIQGSLKCPNCKEIVFRAETKICSCCRKNLEYKVYNTAVEIIRNIKCTSCRKAMQIALTSICRKCRLSLESKLSVRECKGRPDPKQLLKEYHETLKKQTSLLSDAVSELSNQSIMSQTISDVDQISTTPNTIQSEQIKVNEEPAPNKQDDVLEIEAENQTAVLSTPILETDKQSSVNQTISDSAQISTPPVKVESEKLKMNDDQSSSDIILEYKSESVQKENKDMQQCENCHKVCPKCWSRMCHDCRSHLNELKQSENGRSPIRLLGRVKAMDPAKTILGFSQKNFTESGGNMSIKPDIKRNCVCGNSSFSSHSQSNKFFFSFNQRLNLSNQNIK